MFEKEAEEIANKRCHEIMCYGHCSFSSPKHHRCGEWHREYNCALDGYHEGFKDCAKARLNVTTISDAPLMKREQLEQAKEIIKNCLRNMQDDTGDMKPIIEQAEQFLKETEQ